MRATWTGLISPGPRCESLFPTVPTVPSVAPIVGAMATADAEPLIRA